MSGIAAKLARDREAAEGLGSHERAVKYLNQDYEALHAECLEAGALFQDPSFPAGPSSLGFKELGPYSSKTQGIQWKRPTVGRRGGPAAPEPGPPPPGPGRARGEPHAAAGTAERRPLPGAGARYPVQARAGAPRAARVPRAGLSPLPPTAPPGTGRGACRPQMPLAGPPGEPPADFRKSRGTKGAWGKLYGTPVGRRWEVG